MCHLEPGLAGRVLKVVGGFLVQNKDNVGSDAD